MFNTIEEFFAQYDKTIDLEEGHPVKGPIQYKITGEGGGHWYLEIDGVDIVVYEGIADRPISTIECPASDYLDLKNGKTNWAALITSKTMKFTGSHKNILQLSDYMKK